MSENPLNSQNAASIVARAKAMIMAPKDEWPKVESEGKSPSQIFTQYALPLILISPICSLIGGQIFGYGAMGYHFRPGFGAALGTAISSAVMSIIGLFLVSYIANFLAPKFGGKDDFSKAFRLVAYAMTAAWVVGVFGLIPMLGILSILGLYSIYVFYTGVTPIMGVPAEQAGGYTAVTVIVAIVVNVVLGMIVYGLMGGPAGMGMGPYA